MPPITSFMEIYPMGAAMVYVGRGMDMTKLKDTFVMMQMCLKG
jgi:hypothetical protein